MYTIDSLEAVIRNLYLSAVTEADYSDESVESMLGTIDFCALLQAVRHHAETVHAYTTQGNYVKSFNYRGAELFSQRATRLYEDFDQTNQTNAVRADRRYELWLLEDMSLVAVACVSVTVGEDEYVTEYREISGERGDPWDSGLCLDLEDLTENLMDLCDAHYECEMPVYEL